MSRIVTRRGLLGMFAAGAAAAIVKPASLMPIIVPRHVAEGEMVDLMVPRGHVHFQPRDYQRRVIEKIQRNAVHGKFGLALGPGMLFISPLCDGNWQPVGEVKNLVIAPQREPAAARSIGVLSMELPAVDRAIFGARVSK